MRFRPASPEEISALSTDEGLLPADFEKVIRVFFREFAAARVSKIKDAGGVEFQFLEGLHGPEYTPSPSQP